jgi:multiple sugar transport system substrate-binding protein
MEYQRQVTRRRFLRIAAGTAAGGVLTAVLAACGSSGKATATTARPAATQGPTVAPFATIAPAATAAPATGVSATTASGSAAAPATSATSVTGSAAAPSTGAAAYEPKNAVTIEYWQYQFDSKVDLVNKLIPEFQKQNPKITVKHVNFPYDDFRTKVAAAVQAGQGPDSLNVYYGWLPAYVQSKFLQPLPDELFSVDKVEKNFYGMVQTAKFNGAYYAVPTAVRVLALFWNKDMLKEAGFSDAPKNWEELVKVAQATTKRDASGKLLQEGITWGPAGQGHAWWRECLNRQNGLVPMSEDRRKLNWSDPLGIEAFTWYTDEVTKYKVAEKDFYTDDTTAFKTGHAAMTVDGNFRISTLQKDAPTLQYGIAPLPEHKSKATFASFWCNSITRKAGDPKGDKYIAAALFNNYLASPAVQKQWTPAVGELPATPSVGQEFLSDPLYKGFVSQLGDAYATFYVSEADDRQAVIDATDQVILKGVSPADAVKEAQGKVQAMMDKYWAAEK